jgi:Transcriptional regulator/sugar kinase
LSAALVCLDGTVSAGTSITIADSSGYYDALETIVDEVQKLNRDEARIIGLCMILPAMIDSKNQRILSTVLELGEETEVIPRICEKYPQFPVAFYNDTACYAYAEKIYSGRREESFVFVNMNQGIGAAFFFDGKMFGGANGMQTQLGHYSVEPNGVACSCGNNGCLEVMIGEKALRRVAAEFGADSLLEKQEIRYSDVAETADKGNKEAGMMMNKIADYLSGGLSNLISLIRPDRIVIGGSGAELGENFLRELTNNIKRRGFHRMVNEVDICYSALGKEACQKGAMRYFFDYNYIFTEDINGRIFLG